MKKLILSLGLLIFLISCEQSDKKIFEFAGGNFRMCIAESPSTFQAREVKDVHSNTVLSQVMEGLVSFNPIDMKIRPQLAKSWKISPDQLTYEFTLRDDVLFHECSVLSSKRKRKLTVEDVVFTFEMIAKKDKLGNTTSAYSSFFGDCIKGMKAFQEGSSKSISGISTQKNKVIIKLIKEDANFLFKLANINAAIISKRLEESGTENLVIGTGPFVYKGISEGEYKTISLEKNANYYLKDKNGNSLPYLDNVELIIEPQKINQLSLFEEGKIEFIETLPTSRISEMLEDKIKDFNGVPPKYILRNNPLLSTNYYFFNMLDERFKDFRVRKAINYAINRSKITQQTLKGQAYEDGVYGIVTPISSIFRGYDFKEIKAYAYDYDPELAKQLLAEAGYPGGKGFGSIKLRVNYGDIHAAVAEEIATQIYNTLGINVNIDASSFEQKTKDADFLKGDLFRIAWFADYLSPESFLTNFYGKIVPERLDEPSQINQSRYKNAAFDSYLEQARVEAKLSNRMKLFQLAEVELMKDPPLIVLWYNGDIQILNAKVRNFYENPLNYYNFTEVYIKEWTKQEFENRIKN
jgi:oligopeptide transport system substrate-binding protein